MTLAALLAIFTARLDAQEKLFAVIIESQPVDVRAELWRRFLESTLPLHLVIVRLNDLIVSSLHLAEVPKS